MSDIKNQVPTSQEELGTRISEAARIVGGKKTLAHKIDASESQLYRYINGSSSPTVEPLVAIAQAAGLSIAWLAMGKGPKFTEDLNDAERRREDIFLADAGDQDAADRGEQRIKEFGDRMRKSRPVSDAAIADKELSPYDVELVRSVALEAPNAPRMLNDLVERLAVDGDAAELAQEFALIPGYSVQVSTGHGAFPSAQETPSRKLAFRRKWLRYRGLAEKDLVLVFAKGDSMEPTISDNNTLMIDTSQRDLSDGSIYVIRTDHHLIAKRVQTLLGSAILLISDNKAYQPIEVKLSEADDLEVIGRVVWIGKDV